MISRTEIKVSITTRQKAISLAVDIMIKDLFKTHTQNNNDANVSRGELITQSSS